MARNDIAVEAAGLFGEPFDEARAIDDFAGGLGQRLALFHGEDAAEIVSALIAAPAVRHVNFTGSTRVGRIVAIKAAEHLKPALLELGGKAPLVILDDADLEGAVNAAAFANHPEQGALTADDFRTRMASDWYRDEDLLVARDATGRLVGYHWTKLTTSQGETRGEVYVLGVDPSYAGRGAGRALLDAGIIHMRSQGATHIDLYVEQSSERVVAMYRTAGFEVTHTDVAYGEAEED